MTWAIGYFLYPYLVEDGGSDLADFFMVPVALGILALCLALARLSRRTRRAAPALEAVIAREGLLYRALSERALQQQQSRRQQDEEARKRAVEQLARRRQKDADERRRRERAWREPDRREARETIRDESMSVARALESSRSEGGSDRTGNSRGLHQSDQESARRSGRIGLPYETSQCGARRLARSWEEMRRNSHRQPRGRLTRPLGCFVASLLAMTIQFDRTPAAQKALRRIDVASSRDKPGHDGQGRGAAPTVSFKEVGRRPVLN